MQNEQINSATQRIGEGIDLLTHRQKLVKMADQSESGWKTVEEYQTNSLADNSEDEKRIRRADVRAAQNMKAERKTKKSRFTPISQSTSTRSSAPIPVQISLPVHRPGKCYECGKPGHWRKDHAAMSMTQNFDKITRLVASLVGQIISMQAAMGSLVRLRTRSLYECIMQKASWDSLVFIKEMAFDVVGMWKENVDFLNGKELLDDKSAPVWCTPIPLIQASVGIQLGQTIEDEI
ncbi:unnamed protein product [Mytilus coruscus]|uniref:CCHC-type domain-containing protein n=1 Tax=Mytilus coruscus TaxID=42192 RepID=A0A6J8CC40_MYTCO|nr:unnamed protein product [Mytilus coruscus]